MSALRPLLSEQTLSMHILLCGVVDNRMCGRGMCSFCGILVHSVVLFLYNRMMGGGCSDVPYQLMSESSLCVSSLRITQQNALYAL